MSFATNLCIIDLLLMIVAPEEGTVEVGESTTKDDS